MDDPLYFIVVLAMLSVVVVLVIGLAGFAAGGEFNRKYGNKLMRMRIAFQFVAVGLIMLYIFVRGTGGP